MVKDKESGTFVIRDSTSYKGSFGLAMKVDQSPTGFSPTAYAGKYYLIGTTWLLQDKSKGLDVQKECNIVSEQLSKIYGYIKGNSDKHTLGCRK